MSRHYAERDARAAETRIDAREAVMGGSQMVGGVAERQRPILTTEARHGSRALKLNKKALKPGAGGGVNCAGAAAGSTQR